MVIELKNRSAKVTSALFLVGLTILFTWVTTVPWVASLAIPAIPNDPELLRSWRHHPAGPQFRHQFRARTYQYNLALQDYQEGLNEYRMALRYDPLSSRTWFDVAKLHWWIGRTDDAQRALRLALRFNPSDARLRWEAAVFLIQLGRQDEAVENLKYLVKIDRSKRSSYIALLRTLTSQTDLIETIMPPDRAVLSDYLDFLIYDRDASGAHAVWTRLMSIPGGDVNPSLTLSYIDLMLSQKMISEAVAAWTATLRQKKFQDPGLPANLIWNSGFERDETLGMGFDWKFRSIPGVDVEIDPGNSKEGKRSLRISFDGTRNVDFSEIWQVVQVRPNTRYALGAHLRTNALTSSSGVRLEVLDFLDGRVYGATQALVGSNDWLPLETSFLTSTRAQAVAIRVRRETSQKLDNLIAGTAWIDQVSLKVIR